MLVLTTYDDDSDIMRAVESGAVGYLLKDTAGDGIIEAVRAAARGESVLAPPVAARLVSRMRAPELPRLTAREVEVLRCVAQGLSNPELATALHIAEATSRPTCCGSSTSWTWTTGPVPWFLPWNGAFCNRFVS